LVVERRFHQGKDTPRSSWMKSKTPGSECRPIAGHLELVLTICSLVSQRRHRRDSRGATGRNIAGQPGHNAK
jgi:hypothetical protein